MNKLVDVLRLIVDQLIERCLHQIGNTITGCSRNNAGITKAQFIKIRCDAGVLHALGFIDDQNDFTPGLAQKIIDGFVVRGQSLTTIDHEKNDIRFGDGLPRLLCHFAQDAVFSDRLKTAGINDEERAFTHPPLAVMAIAREPGEISDQRIARARHSVEQGRFADIWPPDQGDDRFHGDFRFWARPGSPLRSRRETPKDYSVVIAISLPSMV